MRHNRLRSLRGTVAFLLVGSLLLPAIPSGAAQTPVGAVRGQVVDYETGAPVGGALVTLPDMGVSVTSNRSGEFIFPDVVPDVISAALPTRRSAQSQSRTDTGAGLSTGCRFGLG
jgi:hypothetical protein